jgi:hypothetical protein
MHPGWALAPVPESNTDDKLDLTAALRDFAEFIEDVGTDDLTS